MSGKYSNLIVQANVLSKISMSTELLGKTIIVLGPGAAGFLFAQGALKPLAIVAITMAVIVLGMLITLLSVLLGAAGEALRALRELCLNTDSAFTDTGKFTPAQTRVNTVYDMARRNQG